jgi:3'-phosphoadenosine 5'-phosphosulfate sulfotransferase
VRGQSIVNANEQVRARVQLDQTFGQSAVQLECARPIKIKGRESAQQVIFYWAGEISPGD